MVGVGYIEATPLARRRFRDPDRRSGLAVVALAVNLVQLPCVLRSLPGGLSRVPGSVVLVGSLADGATVVAVLATDSGGPGNLGNRLSVVVRRGDDRRSNGQRSVSRRG